MQRTFVIVEDHEIVRAGLRAMLEREPDWRVIGEADRVAEGVELVKQLKPTCMIVDLGLDGGGGIVAIRAVRAAGFAGSIVVLTGNGDPAMMSAALKGGADAYVFKEQALERLKQAIEGVKIDEVAGTEAAAGAGRVGAHVPVVRSENMARLTQRELEVLQGLVGGESVKEIAFAFGLSPKTVEAHRARLMMKLNVKNLADLTRLAMREGLVRF